MKLKRQKCRYCRCTDDRACEGGCYWAEPGVCSQCRDKREAAAMAVREWRAAYKAFVEAPEAEMPAAARRSRLAKGLAIAKLRILGNDLDVDGLRYHCVPSRNEIQIKPLRAKKGAPR